MIYGSDGLARSYVGLPTSDVGLVKRMRRMRFSCPIGNGKFLRTWKEFRQRGSAPFVFELFLFITLIASFLFIGLISISRNHKEEMDNLKKSSSDRIGQYRRRFDERMKQASAAQRNRELSKINQHKKEVSKVRDLHQGQIEKIIADIELQLKDLKDLSKAYWDQHALTED